LSDEKELGRNSGTVEPYAGQMIADIEALEKEIPRAEFQNTSSQLRAMMSELEEKYERKEQVIDLVLQLGTGYETRKALRMVPMSVLEKWAAELSTRR
jgi:hypothetical protein